MSDDRLFTTSYRYEVPNSNAQFLRRSLALQRSRIETDEKIASRIDAENKVASELERARWFTSLEEDSEKKREKRNSEMMDSELKTANEEFMKVLLLLSSLKKHGGFATSFRVLSRQERVRRAQLQKLLLDEHLQYEKELNGTGKAFYKKRI